jgi:hypothetical protein
MLLDIGEGYRSKSQAVWLTGLCMKYPFSMCEQNSKWMD